MKKKIESCSSGFETTATFERENKKYEILDFVRSVFVFADLFLARMLLRPARLRSTLARPTSWFFAMTSGWFGNEKFRISYFRLQHSVPFEANSNRCASEVSRER